MPFILGLLRRKDSFKTRRYLFSCCHFMLKKTSTCIKKLDEGSVLMAFSFISLALEKAPKILGACRLFFVTWLPSSLFLKRGYLHVACVQTQQVISIPGWFGQGQPRKKFFPFTLVLSQWPSCSKDLVNLDETFQTLGTITHPFERIMRIWKTMIWIPRPSQKKLVKYQCLNPKPTLYTFVSFELLCFSLLTWTKLNGKIVKILYVGESKGFFLSSHVSLFAKWG